MQSFSKGVILAGGSGTRMYPSTVVVNKHLLPVYDKPLIYYPLTTLMLMGLREIMIVTNPEFIEQFRQILGTGEQWGIKLHYQAQSAPNGLAHAFLAAEEFVGNDPCAVILGDNVYHGHGLSPFLFNAMSANKGATIFGYRVQDARRYGVVDFDRKMQVTSLEEKPENPKTNIAVTGLYLYDGTAAQRAKDLKPSARGEYEITDLNNSYLADQSLSLNIIERGYAWFDAGTPESLLVVSEYVETLASRQGNKTACPEEIAYRTGNITLDQLQGLVTNMPASDYRSYLEQLVHEEAYKLDRSAA
ncbi:MAG: glucose-1-phosphate thymidylyltransferase RfbA [Alphaproteobacteria bacterium]